MYRTPLVLKTLERNLFAPSTYMENWSKVPVHPSSPPFNLSMCVRVRACERDRERERECVCMCVCVCVCVCVCE